MSNYVFKGVYIPAKVWLDDRMTPTQKMLLCEIDAMSDGKNNPCFAGNEHFAKHLKCETKSISNMISYLEKLGYLKRYFSNNKTYEGRTLWTDFNQIVTPPSEDVTPPSEDVTPPSEDVTPPSEDVTPPSEDGAINKPINSPINKLINYSSLGKSKKSVSFNSFREQFKKNLGTDKFYTIGLGWLVDTPFVLNQDGLIINAVSNKLLTKEESLKIWNYLYDGYKQHKKEA